MSAEKTETKEEGKAFGEYERKGGITRDTPGYRGLTLARREPQQKISHVLLNQPDHVASRFFYTVPESFKRCKLGTNV